MLSDFFEKEKTKNLKKFFEEFQQIMVARFFASDYDGTVIFLPLFNN